MLVARVGGAWANTTRAGLWYWTCHDDSSIVWDDIGARLLNLIRDLMCMLLRLYALRSCRRCLARLFTLRALVLGFSLWLYTGVPRSRSSTTCIIVGLDVCVSTIVFVSSLLSAVYGATHFIVVCGVGISTMTLVLLTSQSELDYLI